MRNLAVVALLGAVLPGCATYIDVKRQQGPLIQLGSSAPGIGILSVHADDEVMARAPNDFSNMTGLVVKVAKDYFAAEAASLTVVNYSELGFQPKWQRIPGATGAINYKLDALAGVPAGVQTPLVTVVKVLDWRTYVETHDKISRDAARVSLLFSTWTRDGVLVKTEVVTADAYAKVNGVRLATVPDAGRMVGWYTRSSPSVYSDAWLPEDREKLFWAALRNAVALHYWPFLPHTISERLALIDDEPLKDGVLKAQAGRYDDALASWTSAYQADPKLHGGYYNAALVHLIRGEDDQADALLTHAVSIESRFLYTDLLQSVRSRMALRRTVGGALAQPSGP